MHAGRTWKANVKVAGQLKLSKNVQGQPKEMLFLANVHGNGLQKLFYIYMLA